MIKFHKNDMFCKICLIHDSNFINGGSWGIDNCPKCGGIETILYKNLNFLQRYRVKRINNDKI